MPNREELKNLIGNLQWSTKAARVLWLKQPLCRYRVHELWSLVTVTKCLTGTPQGKKVYFGSWF